jgi:hypothetical protein
MARQPPEPMPMSRTLHEIEFYSLPAAMQRDLIAAFAVGGGGSTIVTKAPPLAWVLLLRLAPVAYVFLLLALLVPWKAPLASAGVPMWKPFSLIASITMALPFVLFVYGSLSAWFRLRMHRALPFRPGRYLLPYALVDAREPLLRIYDLRGLKDLKLIHNSINFIYTGSTFIFTFHDAGSMRFFMRGKRKAEDALERLQDLQEEGRAAQVNKDLETAKWIDPLFELRARQWRPFSGIASPGQAPVPALLRHRKVVALCAGLAIAAATTVLGFYLQEKRQYQWAVQANTDLAYQHYLEHGRLYRSKIAADHPRVAFEDARRSGKIGRLERLLTRFPGSGLEAEVNAEILKLSAPAAAPVPAN